MRVAVMRSLPIGGNVSMNRYADEIEMVVSADLGWQASAYSMSAGTRDNRLAKLMRYKAKYLDYPRYASRIDADLYHVADHTYAFLAGSLPEDRTIVTCHDLMLLTGDEWDGPPSSSPVVMAFRFKMRYLRRAAAVIAASTKTKRDIIALDLADEEKLRVIPPPVNPVFTPEARASAGDVRLSLGLAADSVMILHVGTPIAYKNLSAVVATLAELRRRGTPATLIRVGRYFDDDLRRQVAALGVADWIVETGPVDDAMLSLLYGAADVLLFPSLKEGFGRPVVEAMASGLPVVASNIDPIAESLDGTGLLLPPTDVNGLASAVQRLYSDASLWQEQSHRGIQKAGRFSRDAFQKKLLRVYEQVIDERLAWDDSQNGSGTFGRL